MSENLSKSLQKAVVGFAGDSGDGVQVIGQQFTKASAILGNDVQTFPDFPAEIRAPHGTKAGVSGFQLQFAACDIHTPGDSLDALIAFNPAALSQGLSKVKTGGILLVDTDKFKAADLKKAGLTENPLETDALQEYQVICVPMTTLVFEAIKDKGLSRAKQRKCKNFFALGIAYWLYQRPLDSTIQWLEQKFKDSPETVDSNISALKAGFNYGETAELLDVPFRVEQTHMTAGTWRQVTGNDALCMGAMMASEQINRPLFVAGYPITPASDILHWFAANGVTTFQAEDEMAAAGAAVGAAFGGSLALTSTSGPGMDLKAETIGLAAMTELPMVIVDVQRAGPSTGMPTKVEQADLLMALYGRHGECPVPVLAPQSSTDCFDIMVEAFSIAVKSMTPVIVLSDAYLANGTQPWQIPASDASNFRIDSPDVDSFKPYQRDEKNLARPWVWPGQKGFEHTIGGLEKEHESGEISYDGANHQKMVALRAEKIEKIAENYPPCEIIGETQGDCLVIGWGSTYGALRSAVESLHNQGYKVGLLHLRHLNPLPKDVPNILKEFKKVICFELNQGQLASILRSRYLMDIQSHGKVKGQPFTTQEVENALLTYLEKS